MTFEAVIKDTVEEAVRDALRDIIKPQRTVFTLSQLADEWQCSKQAIINWTRKTAHPLPVHYLGSDPRFHKSEVDQWSREEAQRKLAA